MKVLIRLFCILLGALTLSFVVTKVVLVPVGQWYEMNEAQSESDLSQAFVIALIAQVICVIAGGWLGDWTFRKWQQRQRDRQKLM